MEGELGGESEVRERQLRLLSSLSRDVSEPSKQLLMKLNIEPNCKNQLFSGIQTVICRVASSLASYRPSCTHFFFHIFSPPWLLKICVGRPGYEAICRVCLDLTKSMRGE